MPKLGKSAAKGPNIIFRKSLETQVTKLEKKAAFHTNKANEFAVAAESVRSAIDTLSQKTPTLFPDQ